MTIDARSEEFDTKTRTLTMIFPNTCIITIKSKNNRAKSKRIATEVCMERADTEEIIVEQQETSTTALTGPRTSRTRLMWC